MSHELSISKWGPAAWRFLHSVSFTYSLDPTLEDKRNMYMFLNSFSKVLPCKKCRIDFTNYVGKTLSEESIHLKSRDDLINYINDAHNHVNRKLGKREFTYKEVRDKYLSDSIFYNNFTNFIIIILLIILLLMVLKRNKKNNM
mgnify:CR=1 FL=1